MTKRLVVLILLVAFVAGGQVPAPGFEAASIKPAAPGDLRGATYQFAPGGGVTVTNGDLKGLIEMAYNVRDFQIAGGPGWVSSERYSISATPGEPRAGGGDTIDVTRLRLQALLAQRFQLKVHRETRELPVYALVVGKTLRLKPVAGVTAGGSGGIRRECGKMTATAASMANLALYLSRQLGRPVMEQTGLSGNYDFQLSWTPDAGPCSEPAAGAPDGPSLFTALQEQLGLKLEATRGPVDVIVIDHAGKAGAN